MNHVALFAGAALLAGALKMVAAAPETAAEARPLRAGIIGLDTSHAPAFTKLFHDAAKESAVAKARVVVAFPGGSADIVSSRDRVPQYTKQMKEAGVEIVDSIPALLEKVDVVLLESVDGRPHLEQALPVFKAGKPLFIDKPLAGSLADAIAIDMLGRKYKTPWFSASSLRFGPTLQHARTDDRLGKIVGCDAWSPCPLEPTHPDLYWYGIHGVEMLFTVLGPDCVSVNRIQTPGTEIAVGVWSDGRVGTFRGLRDAKHEYGCTIFGTKAIAPGGGYEGYGALVEQIAEFFQSRRPPVNPEETIRILAFMSAADESKAKQGASVKLDDVIARARIDAEARLKALGE